MKVAIVNQDFADRFLKGNDPLTMRLSVPQLIPKHVRVGVPLEWQIVGVFHNVRSWGFREDNPEMYVPFCRLHGRVRDSACGPRATNGCAEEHNERRARRTARTDADAPERLIER